MAMALLGELKMGKKMIRPNMDISRLVTFIPFEILKIESENSLVSGGQQLIIYYETEDRLRKYIIKETIMVDAGYSDGGMNPPDKRKNNWKVIAEKEIENG